MPKYNRRRPIRGVTGRRVPGSARMSKPRNVGGFKTNVPRQRSAGGEKGSAIFREFHRQQVRDTRGRFAGGWGFAWIGVEGVANNLDDWEGRVAFNIQRAAKRLAEGMREYMQANAPWQDDPTNDTNARESLQAEVVFHDDLHFTIFLGHGADIYYGIWLEVRWGGKYSIIVPTAHKFGPMLENEIRTMT